MHLYEEFNKLHPEQVNATLEKTPESMTFEDMTAYFNGLKESMMKEFKEQIEALKTSEASKEAPEDKTQPPAENLDKEENE